MKQIKQPCVKQICFIIMMLLAITGCTPEDLSYAQETIQTIKSISDNHGSNTQIATADSADTISIASFNIQVFGKSKAGKPDVMEILAKIITQYDIVAIQEIRDKSGTAIQKLEAEVDALGIDYSTIIGPRLGRTSSKEQYAYMYRTATVKPGDSYTYDVDGRDILSQ